MNASEDEIEEAVVEIITTGAEDGFSFNYEGIELLQQPHMDYPGYRVSLKVAFGRMKDYHDLLLLIREPHVINFSKLQAAIRSTFHHRGTPLELVGLNEQEINPIERLWTAHLRNLQNTSLRLPGSIQEVIAEINESLKTVVT